MEVTYKDINLLTQKSSVAGTEKIPVSDTQYLTTAQIATSKQVHLADESEMPASPDASTLYLIDDDGSGGGGGSYTLPIASASTLGGVKVGDGLSINSSTGVLATISKIVYLTDESQMPASPDANTLYAIYGTGGGGGSVTVDSALSSTSENPVQNKAIYAAIGDIETLLAAL